jgi:dTDP-glucose 4,6-dehydratase
MPKTIIVTGGCGFIGHHVVQHFYKTTDWNIIIFDKLTYASCGLQRLRNLDLLNNNRIKVFTIDLKNDIEYGIRQEIGEEVEIIMHLAAETHVDNSISDPKLFIENNILSTYTMLEYARTLNSLKCFFYFSTDEVFGPAPGKTAYKEWDRHKPTNPYSASKSAAENICIAYENTYKTPVMIVNVMNAFGERQHQEKFIPNTINKIMKGETVIIHSGKDMVPGSRFYIHARNIAAALLFLLEKGKTGEKYNIVGEKEVDNLELARFIAKTLDKELKYELVDFHSSRPGHDLRYGLDGEKMAEMGWKLPVNFEESLEKSIRWTVENPEWLEC